LRWYTKLCWCWWEPQWTCCQSVYPKPSMSDGIRNEFGNQWVSTLVNEYALFPIVPCAKHHLYICRCVCGYKNYKITLIPLFIYMYIYVDVNIIAYMYEGCLCERLSDLMTSSPPVCPCFYITCYVTVQVQIELNVLLPLYSKICRWCPHAIYLSLCFCLAIYNIHDIMVLSFDIIYYHQLRLLWTTYTHIHTRTHTHKHTHTLDYKKVNVLAYLSSCLALNIDTNSNNNNNVYLIKRLYWRAIQKCCINNM